MLTHKKPLWLFSHCSCGSHVSKLKSNITRQGITAPFQVKVGGAGSLNVTSGHRYYKVRSLMTELGIEPKGSYGYLYNPENKKWIQIFQDDTATRKERILGIL